MVFNRRHVRWGAVRLAGTSALVLMGCGRTESDYERGTRLFGERDYRGAISALEAARKSKPGDARIPRQLGLVYSTIGDRPTAIRYLEAARDKAQADTTVRLTLAGLYLSDGRHDDAIREATAILDARPTNTTALSIIGTGYLAKGQPEAAIAAFQKITEITPRDPAAHYLIGMALLTENQTTQAAEQFEDALSILPALIDPLSKIVQIDLAAKQPDAAIERIKKQLVTAGYSPQLHELLGITYIAIGKNDLAEGTLAELIRRTPNYIDAYYRLGELYRSTGRYDKALLVASRGLGYEPDNLSLHLLQGQANEGAGNLGGARWSYQQALRTNPKYSAAAARLAIVLAETGKDTDSAMRFITSVRESDAANPAVADAMGWVLFQRGQYAPALASLKEAVAKLPNDPGVAYHIGMAYAKSGDVPSARRELQRAVDSPAAYPGKEEAQRALAALRCL